MTTKLPATAGLTTRTRQAGFPAPVSLSLSFDYDRPDMTLGETEVNSSLLIDFRSSSAFTLVPAKRRLKDPISGNAPYRLVVVDMFGNRICELDRAGMDPFTEELNNGSSFGFTMKDDDPKIVECLVPQREVQLWRSDELLGWGVLTKGRSDNKTVNFQVPGLEWYFTKRFVGAAPMPNLLLNGSFEEGERYWNFGYTKGSIPARPPIHSIDKTRTLNGLRSLNMQGASTVESTTQTLMGDITFAFDSAALTSKGMIAIDNILEQIIFLSKVRLDGHADSTGSASYNMSLSIARANAVKSYMVSRGWPSDLISVTGHGESQPKASNATAAGRAQNRRVEVRAKSEKKAKGHRQWAHQRAPFYNSGTKPIALTLVAWMWIEVYNAANADGIATYMSLTKDNGSNPSVVVAKASIALDSTMPRKKWVRMESSMLAPVGDNFMWLDVYLYPPDGKVIFDEVSLTANEVLGFYNVDQADIVAGLVQHAQDESLGKTWLNIGTSCPPTKVKRSREYPWIERMYINEALSEFPTLANGVDIGMTFTPTERRLASYYPRKGRKTDYLLSNDSNLSDFTVDYDGEQVANKIVVQADGEGSDREEGVWEDLTGMDGVVLEKVYNATPGSAVSSLRQQAQRGVSRYSRPVIIPTLSVHKDFTQEVIEKVALGDVVRVRIKKGWIDLDDYYRVTGRTIDPKTDTISLTIQPEDFLS